MQVTVAATQMACSWNVDENIDEKMNDDMGNL